MKLLAFLAKESIFGKTRFQRILARESLVERLDRLRSPKLLLDTCYSSIRSIPNILSHSLKFRAGISSLAAIISTGFSINTCQNNVTGAVYNPVGTSLRITKSYSIGTAASNGASGGCDEVFSFQQGIAAGSSATLDLTQMTNLLQRAAVSIVRVKGYQFRLLSSSDDSTITPAPSAGSVCCVTNFGPAVPNALDFGNGGSGLTLNITVSGSALATATINAAGSGYPPSCTFLVNVNQSGGSSGLIAVTTNASGVPTGATTIPAVGTGYTGVSGLATTIIGQYLLATGSAHMYFDPTAAGFDTVSATAKNIRFYNLDASNAITLEIDILAATS